MAKEKMNAHGIKMSRIKEWLESVLISREDEIRGFLVALLAREHMLMVGPPGTAKSLLALAGCLCIKDAKFFQQLMTKYSTPEEVNGPISLKGLEHDKYERKIENKLPDATIAFLDEVYKANSAILNSLLRQMNERKFENGTNILDTPLQTMVAASNEFPEGEELGAMFDRFALKYVVHYIGDDDFLTLLQMSDVDPSSGPKISLMELERCQKDVENKVSISNDVFQKVKDIRINLMQKGIVASDRKWRQAIKLIKANAYLNGNHAVQVSDLMILKDALWKEEAQIALVVDVIMESVNPAGKVALEISNNIQSILNNADLKVQTECTEVIEKVKELRKKLRDAKKRYSSSEDLKKLEEYIQDKLEMLSTVLVEADQ